MTKIPKAEWIVAVLLVAAIKLVSVTTLYYGWKFVPRADYGSDLWITRQDTSFLENLANFDGAWFVRLGAIGYKKLAAGDYDLSAETERLRVMDELGAEQGMWPREESYKGFDRGYGYRHWPFFPWLINAADKIGLDPVAAAVVMSNIFTLAYGLVLFALARKDFSLSISLFAVAVSQLHPGGYALTAAYNESLFLVFAAGSMLSAREEKWWVAGLLAMGASMTRIFGVVLAVPLAYEWMASRSENAGSSERLSDVLSIGNIKRSFKGAYERPVFWWALLIPAGTLVVFLFFHYVAGDAMIWTKVHEENVHGHINWPWLMMVETYNKGWHVWMKELPLHALLLVVLVASFGRVRHSYWVWMLAFFLFHTSNGNHSYLRYQVQCLPMFIALAAIVETRPWLKYTLLCLFASLSGIFSAMYINGYWVA